MNKKLITALVLSVLFALSFSIFSFASELENEDPNVFSGLGTESSPYLINDAEDIMNLSVLVNSGDMDYLNAYYKITDDIDLNGINHTPIGTETYPFSGVFDGGSHIISGLSINSTERYLGFFGVTKNANLMNINIKNANITTNGSNLVYAGILVGLFNVIDETDTFNVKKCSVEGSIDASCTASCYSGGMAGKCEVKHGTVVFSDCHSKIQVDVEANKTACGAGIIANMIAQNDGFVSVVNSIVEGSVEANSLGYESFAGGVMGKANQQDGNWSDFVPVDETIPEESSLLSASNVYTLNGCVVDCQVISNGKITTNISNLVAHVSEYVVVGTNYVSSETSVQSSPSAATCNVKVSRDTLLSKDYLSDIVGLDFANTWVSVFGKLELRIATPYIATSINSDNKIYVQLVGFNKGKLYVTANSNDERMLETKIYPYSDIGEEPKQISFSGITYHKLRFFMLDTVSFSPLSDFAEITLE